jgi:hypothetical protein
VPANFEGHKFSKTAAHTLSEAGFHVGDVVVIKRRITAEFGPKKTRADVAKNTTTFIKGVTDDGLVVVSLEKTIGKVEHKCDYAIKLDNIKHQQVKGKAAVKADDKTGPGAKAGFPCLDKVETKTELIVCKTWAGNQTMNDAKSKNGYLTSSMAHFMFNLMRKLPVYEDKDFIVCKRDGAYEVWTARAFKAKQILFAPCTTEYKDRFWTQGRAVILGNTAELNYEKTNKSFVADGRLRNQVENTERPFALFWIIPRSKEEKDWTMMQEMTEVSVSYSLKLPQELVAETIEHGADTLPQIPILFNPKDLKKNVPLIAPFDSALKELGDKNTKDMMDKKAAEEKKRKSESAAAPGGKKSKSA